MSDIYDENAYRRFAENLKSALTGTNIRRVKLEQLRKDALKSGVKTIYGSWGWRSFTSSRIGPKTVYLGSPQVRLPRPTPLQSEIIAAAPDELHAVLQLVRKLPFVHLRRRMGENGEFNPICNLYMSVADPKNYRIAYMYGHTLGEPDPRRPGPEFTMIHIPEEHQIRQQVLALPEYHLNICMGSDYMGEDKKGFLRQAMWFADEHGMLGLHAGTKLVTVRGAGDGKLKKIGVFLFGLSATGKSTWSCHRLGLDEEHGEGTQVIQDDIVFLKPDGSAFGSEQNFFVKTDVDPELQEAMWWALTDSTALYENVMIDAAGRPDFLDETLCANGRAVIRKDRLRVRKRKKLVRIDYPGLDLPPLASLDEVVFAFITRRNTIMSFAQELSPQQAVLAYLWGESSHSYASQPAKAGESVRTVGTDPFIIGSRARKVNRFRDIIMRLVEDYPGKVRFFQYNTGGVGEIIEEIPTPTGKAKRMVRKAVRVPIPLMAAIQRGDLRGTNEYRDGPLGTREIHRVEGFDLEAYRPERFYDPEQIQGYIRDLIDGRRRFTEEVATEGLDRDIIAWAEKSFAVAPRPVSVAVSPPVALAPATSADGDGSALRRPPRPLGWRVR